MAHLDTTVWLRPALQGCGRCLPSAGGQVCIGDYGQVCDKPVMVGDPALLRRVLLALRSVADDGGNLVEARRISALRVADGEVELELRLRTDCGLGQRLFDEAFQVLRRLLPDTDVYVRPAR